MAVFARRAPCFVCCLILIVGANRDAATTRADDAEMPIEVLAIRENSERLRTGEYRATGTLTLEPGISTSARKPRQARPGGARFQFDREGIRGRGKKVDRGNEEESKVDADHMKRPVESRKSDDGRIEQYNEEIESLFDYDNGRLFFRRTRRQTAGDVSTFGSVRHAWFVGTPDRTLLVRGREHSELEVAILGPVSSPLEAGPFFEPVFDARSMGRGGLEELRIHFGADFLSHLRPDEIRVTDEGGGIRRLETVRIVESENARLPVVVSTWWCDERQGYQPVRYVSKRQILDPTTPAHETYNRVSKPRDECEFSWGEIDDVWVLQSLSIRGRRGTSKEHLQLAFDWKAINQRVSAERFEWQNWDLPDNSRVVDLRMGEEKPILVETVGVPTEIEVPLDVPKASHHLKVLLFINVIALIVMIGWLGRRYWRYYASSAKK